MSRRGDVRGGIDGFDDCGDYQLSLYLSARLILCFMFHDLCVTDNL